jgi:hypothetical protein
MPEMKSRPQLHARARLSIQNSVADVHSVLQVRKEDSFFQDEIADVISPNRKTIFQSKLTQAIGALEIKLSARPFLPA